MTWMVMYSAWAINRFQTKPSGRTAYQELSGHAYQSEVLEFGSTCLARCSDITDLEKLDPRWTKGIWLGKSPSSDERIVAGADGIIMARFVKLALEQDRELMTEMRWTPWQTKRRMMPEERFGEESPAM